MKHHREDQHVIVGKLTAIGKRHITLGAGTQVLLPDQRLLNGIEVGMSLTLVVTRMCDVLKVPACSWLTMTQSCVTLLLFT
jgi:hypothetical protein